MKKPIIGIVGREDLSKEESNAIMLIGDKYRRAVIESRRYSIFNITSSEY